MKHYEENKVQVSINDRKVRIKHQQYNIELERKKALERIKKHKKTQQYINIPNPDFNQNLSNMKHRIRRVESRIKHLWAFNVINIIIFYIKHLLF